VSSLISVVTFVGIVLLTVVAMVSCDRMAEERRCAARWADSGYSSSYDPHAGCRVKVNGKWMPEKLLRFDEVKP
jgi:hypothetical protein